MADLAFSRDVLDEALRLADARDPALSAEEGGTAAPRRATAASPERPPLSIVSLGGFQVRRAGVPVSASELGGERARELLAALLGSRRPVHREQLLAWVWPDEPLDRGTRALADAVASLRRALGPPGETSSPSSLVAEGATHRLELAPEDSWDVDELLGADGRTLDAQGLAGGA